MSTTIATAIAAAGITAATALTGTGAHTAVIPAAEPRAAAAAAAAVQAPQLAGRHRAPELDLRHLKHLKHLKHLAHLAYLAGERHDRDAYQGRHRGHAAGEPVLQADVQVTARARTGSPEAIAAGMLGAYGWPAGQMSCLEPLWDHESGWRTGAQNPSSGAYGIPQALPGGKMAAAGADWQTDAATQIRWGLGYIKSVYGTPCGAWEHFQADGWY